MSFAVTYMAGGRFDAPGVCVAMEPDHAISISGHYQRKKRKFL